MPEDTIGRAFEGLYQDGYSRKDRYRQAEIILIRSDGLVILPEMDCGKEDSMDMKLIEIWVIMAMSPIWPILTLSEKRECLRDFCMCHQIPGHC